MTKSTQKPEKENSPVIGENRGNSITTKKSEYKVGYCRPPKEYQFPKGVKSGGTKPKGARSWNTVFEEAIRKIAKEKKLKIDDPEVEMVVTAVTRALKGNYNYFKDIMDRRYGKPKEPIEIESKLEKIIVEIVEGNGTAH